MRRTTCIVAVALIIATLGPAGSAKASHTSKNAVAFWNETAVSTVLGEPATNQSSAAVLHVAIVQAAVYDAVMSIERTHEPYASSPQAAPGASLDAAVAAAAHDVLDEYYPDKQTVEDAYTQSLADVPDGPAEDDGVKVGQQAAAALIALRQNDGRFASVPPPYEGTGPGEWHRTSPSAPITPWTGQVRPFLVRSPEQFRPEGPNELSSAEYADQFNETRLYGVQTGSLRNSDQDEIAQFWTENTVGQYNRALRDLAAERALTTPDTARMLAMTELTAADAMITCWNTKYHYLAWRPITAINEADTDGNPGTTKPPTTWVPRSPTANHPEYVSGHACLTGAITRSLQEFLGTQAINLVMNSTAKDTKDHHTFRTTGDLRAEVENARIFGGDHFRKGGTDGTKIGDHVAKWALKRFFGAV
jgi:hypothetical protein